MKKIVGMMSPFALKQKFYILEDGNTIDMFECTIHNFSKIILDKAKEHDTNQVDLAGPSKYLSGVKQQLQEEIATKYSEANIEINII